MRYTTKKTNMMNLVVGLIFTAVFIGVGVYFNSLAEKAEQMWQSNNAEMLHSMAIILFVFGAVELYTTICGFVSYADVYENKIVGCGLICYGLAIAQFDVSYDQIIDISMVMNKLKIKTNDKSYDIVTTPDRGREIISYYQERKKA